MPSVVSGSKVLVTGANGYVAFWIVKYLLEGGFSVRATVRSESKGTYLNQQFASFVDQGKLELAYVRDITVVSIFFCSIEHPFCEMKECSSQHLCYFD